MQRLLFGLVVVACLAVPAAAVAAPRDFATGAGSVGDGAGQALAHVDFAAHEQADGDAVGHLAFTATGFTRIYADVTCLRVDGNHAVLGGPTRPGTFADAFNIRSMAFVVSDNGEPGGGTPDQITPILSPDPNADLCSSPDAASLPLTQGNITVKDR